MDIISSSSSMQSKNKPIVANKRKQPVSEESKLKQLIKHLTTVDLPAPPQELLNELKVLVKTSDRLIAESHKLLLKQLAVDHAQIRLATFQVIEYLFSRSKEFRNLTVSQLDSINNLTLGVNNRYLLPPPLEAAKKLRARALSAMNSWKQTYGMHYPRLITACRYLKGRKGMNFRETRSEVEIRREQQHDLLMANLLERDLERVMAEIRESSDAIQETIVECENCFSLLIPKLDAEDFRVISEYEKNFPIRLIVPLNNTTGTSKDIPKSSYNNNNLTTTTTTTSTTSTTSTTLTDNNNNNNNNNNLDFEASGSVSDLLLSLSDGDPTPIREDLLPSYQAGELKTGIYDYEDQVLGAETQEPMLVNTGNFTHTQRNSLFNLFGDICDSSSDTSDVDSSEDMWEEVTSVHDDFREHDQQIYSNFELDLNVVKKKVSITASEDNLCILENLKKSARMIISHYISQVMKWTNTLSKAGRVDYLKVVLEIKAKLAKVIAKIRTLNIVDPMDNTTIEFYSYVLNENANSNNHRDNENSTIYDPTSIQAQTNTTSINNNNSSSSNNNNISISAPLGLDLNEWDNNIDKERPLISNQSGLHRFWAAEQDDTTPSDLAISMFKSRVIMYQEPFMPVLHHCSAKLPNGKLCTRQDRIKCPFHGKIMPRDDEGRIRGSNFTEEQKSIESPEETISEEKQYIVEEPTEEISVLRELITKMKQKREKKRKSQSENNINSGDVNFLSVAKLKNSKRKKLIKVLINKSNVNKVSDALDEWEQSKNRLNFIHNFNYALHK